MLHLLCNLVATPFQFLHHSDLKAIFKVVMHETLDNVAREEPSILLLLLLPERNQTNRWSCDKDKCKCHLMFIQGPACKTW